jgi:hypothetical protein
MCAPVPGVDKFLPEDLRPEFNANDKGADAMASAVQAVAPPAGLPQPGQSMQMPDQQAMRRAMQSLAVGALGRRGDATMRTGPRGIDPRLLNLGRPTLLAGGSAGANTLLGR